MDIHTNYKFKTVKTSRNIHENQTFIQTDISEIRNWKIGKKLKKTQGDRVIISHGFGIRGLFLESSKLSVIRMTDLEYPTFKGKNLQTCIGNESKITIEDPQSPLDRFIESDNYVFDLENMA